MAAASRLAAFAFGSVLALTAAGPVSAGSPRPGWHALVIGNQAYPSSPLRAPRFDGEAVAAALEGIGFDVTARYDLGRAPMDAAIADFRTRLQPGGVALVYFSGHGVQVADRNFLLPTDAPNPPPVDLARTGVSMHDLLASLASVGSAANILILDACRAAPYGVGSLSKWSRGLAGLLPAEVPTDSFIAYSAAPGGLAEDGRPPRHSPYAHALLKHIGEPGLRVEELFVRIRAEVFDYTDQIQSPGEYSGLRIPLRFREAVTVDMQLDEVDDDAFVLLDGREVLSSASGDVTRAVTLHPGRNVLTVKVFNQHTFRGGMTWRKPEGWSYRLRVTGAALPRQLTLAGAEDPVEKDGPHHGKLFTVSQAVLELDPKSGAVTLPLREGSLWATGFSSIDATGPEEPFLTLRWAVLRRGVRIFDAGTALRAPAAVRREASSLRPIGVRAAEVLGTMTDADLVIAAARLRKEAVTAVEEHVRWVSGHEKQRDKLRNLVARSRFEEIRSLYRAAQVKNLEARELLAGVSDADLRRLVDALPD